MKPDRTHLSAPGPFRADQLRSGDPYELSRGHAVLCLPTGARGSGANLTGALVLGTDPAVSSAGVDTGFSPEPGTLRAPDIAVGNVPDTPGWAPGAPPLAVEYADRGQDEGELQVKIEELFAAGTRFIWVVRLTGPRRVEVYEPGQKIRTVLPGEALTAPGVLQNAVPVEALYDRDAALEVNLRNLLQRRGFESIEAIREGGRQEGMQEGRQEGMQEGRQEGRQEGQLAQARAALRLVLRGRGLAPQAEDDARIERCAELPTLERWLQQALAASTVAEALRE